MPETVLLKNIGWLATPATGEKAAPYTIELPDADALLLKEGRISWIGKADQTAQKQTENVFDCEGRGVTPGLIDFHAHPVFAGTREEEFELRTRGARYQEIAAAGGGILNSAARVRKANPKGLEENARPYLDNALAHGTTTLEAKSGYGLDLESELKLLRVIRELDQTHPLDLVPTFLGAHEYPLEYREDHEGYLRLLTEEMLPSVAREELAVACDVFCERGVFSIEEGRRILTRARELGLKTKVHADQLSPLGGTKLAVEMGSLSADHIEFIDAEAIEMLAGSDTVAGLLPVAAHFLRMKEDPPVNEMIEKGVQCALATDFNPGSAMCENMQMALHLATIRFRITAEQAFWMATAGSALALGLEDRGAIAEGLLADLVIWDSPNLKTLPYHFGINQAHAVFKRGELVAREGQRVG